MTTLRDGRILLPVVEAFVPRRKALPDKEFLGPVDLYDRASPEDVRKVWLLESRDHGVTWRRRLVRQERDGKWIARFGRIVELHIGDLLMTVYWGDHLVGSRATGYLRSTDGGGTWSEPVAIAPP